jgi:hypothetical protein
MTRKYLQKVSSIAMLQRRFKSTSTVAISKNKSRQARLIYGFDGKTSRDYLLDVSKTTKRGLEV